MQTRSPAQLDRIAALRAQPTVSDSIEEDRLIEWEERVGPRLTREQHEAVRAAAWARTQAGRDPFEPAVCKIAEPPLGRFTDEDKDAFVPLLTLDAPSASATYREQWALIAEQDRNRSRLARLPSEIEAAIAAGDAPRAAAGVRERGEVIRAGTSVVVCECPRCGRRSRYRPAVHARLVAASVEGCPPWCGFELDVRLPCQVPVSQLRVVPGG